MNIRNLFLLLLIISEAYRSSAQTDSFRLTAPPEFIGGEVGLGNFLQNHIHYPAEAMEKGIIGTVYVVFVVDTVGNVDSVKVAKSINKYLDEESVRVVSMMSHKWKSGVQKGKRIRMNASVPVKYKMSEQDRAGHMHIFPVNTWCFNKGMEEMKKEDFENAVLFFNDALSIKHGDIDALYNRGLCKQKLGDQKGMCWDWNRIKQLGKSNADELLEKYCK